MPSVRSALVTGITGQDGGYLAERLVEDGVVVHGLVRQAESVPPHLTALGDAVRLHPVSLTDESGLRELLRVAAPSEVYNLVGLSSVAQSWQEPALTAEVNGVFVARLLELVRQQRESAGVDIRFVQASSGEIFAGTAQVPQDESTPLSPRSPYGASKAFAHALVQAYRDRGLHATNAVLYNHESPRRPRSFVTRKITSTVAAIAQGRVSELVLGNLDARRDWGWAPDYVDALVRAARQPEADDYVIATGVGHSVEDFVAAAFARIGTADWRPYVRTDPRHVRPTDAAELIGRATRARDVLGWAPTLGFTDIVDRMVEADLRDRKPEH